jgi:uncharacterized protein (UPF0261 family)
MNTILLIGTADTKSDEMIFLRDCMIAQGAAVVVMDVGVLDKGTCPVDITNNQVCAAANSTLASIIESGDENTAMMAMAEGASRLALEAVMAGHAHGVLILGGTMGTDLALDVASALPLGVPKVVLSTVAHSHLIPPERIPPDLITVLWAGGLYGLNSVCKAALAQAAGAAVGAVNAAAWLKNSSSDQNKKPQKKPLIGMTSLGKSCLSYMVNLKPALEARGFEVAVFHTTGMGGRAFESMAAQGLFAAVLDLSLQELANHVGGSVVTSGASRLLGAGLAGVPQIVAPGAADMVDFAAWDAVPESLAGRSVHVHNRLIASATSPASLRKTIAREIVQRLNQATGRAALIMPLQGVEAWDRIGAPLHDPDGLQAFTHALRSEVAALTSTAFTYQEIDAHINDDAFCDAVLAQLDAWIATGLIKL